MRHTDAPGTFGGMSDRGRRLSTGKIKIGERYMTDVTLTGMVVDPRAARCQDLAVLAQSSQLRSVEAWLSLGAELLAQRELMPADRDFGRWCAQYENFGVRHKQNLSYAMNAAWYCGFTGVKPQEAAELGGVRALDKLARVEKKRARRAERDAQLEITETPDLATLTHFPILYVDPPWRYDHVESPDARQIENHYPTMTAAELEALELPAADDSVLLMWATSPKLAEAITLMGVWGFEYRTCMVWVKDRIGMGYYARQRHELLLIGKRGNLPVPDADRRPDSVQEYPRGPHSAKPHEFYDLIESMWPGTPKVELFARNRREGWASWGNQA